MGVEGLEGCCSFLENSLSEKRRRDVQVFISVGKTTPNTVHRMPHCVRHRMHSVQVFLYAMLLINLKAYSLNSVF